MDELCSPDIVDHAAPPGVPAGMEGAKQVIEMYLGAFPDLNVTVEDMITEGDKVATNITIRATHKGDLMGIPPSGKQVATEAMEIHRIADGKIVEHWEVLEQVTMMQQIGVIPTPE